MDNDPTSAKGIEVTQTEEAPKKPATPPLYRSRDFWLGVGAFVILNGFLSGAAMVFPKWLTPIGYAGMAANIGVLILLAVKRQKAALGMVAVIAFLMVLTLCIAPLVLVAICFTSGTNL